MLLLQLGQFFFALCLYGLLALICVSLIGSAGWVIAGVVVLVGWWIINHDAKLAVQDPQMFNAVYKSPAGSLATMLFYGGMLGGPALLLVYLFQRVAR